MAGKKKEGGKLPGSKADVKTMTLHWKGSGICTPRDQKAALKGLGLRRLGERVVREDTPSIRGMVHKVRHLVEIEG
jgi:large subunit ribosomal protein L30